MWENISVIQNFRHFVRFNIVLVPFLSLLLAYSIIEFVKIYNDQSTKNNKLSYVLYFVFSIIILLNYILYSSQTMKMVLEYLAIKKNNFC